MDSLKYINHYSEITKTEVLELIKQDKLALHLKTKYPNPHVIKTDKALFSYVNELKNAHIKNAPTLSKVLYDGKINVIHNALGTHHIISRVQGSKLKSKNEIRVASMFKSVPQEFLEMIVVHELAHFKVKEHNKAFYNLCEYMQPSYHQTEFDVRLYLTQMDIFGKIDEWN
ncbi:MAG: metal-dependent hydrolase [Sulfurimonas sp. RIFCSPHIGHO2_12_FULL_36_9]|uniref:YgjP-like metallopeptidase domain-containing protein n=1 Tax=Sulfurimonas sp. RIFCSPLOWO2_12_36_12 TaxID=1802253 RepID=UPI0008D7D3F7|nr:YgjP-like metallopeptidase domain-containing protein [Sulfurimonas sp. RIFCSPLOWO2_12_36_12]OHD97912.1 MAG: metal-dependent hydrolase [Sulfurimonas sp. RIFCSPLOWO2_02_FULL_36_28]OHD98741.1 MAG: metal-dependent hydrolase [Sulfurimonas sp. RIFCSPHIGHO2_12_FULL_36_9]OHE02010.1 MAG: metal-dependent hydrolase [Sulfurimonas sp. RIFCSPLOWO2_12_36_12]OHE08286.1 MAG: metal-dependent hydrolase [Sulfurimonas sp. RIFCSPLOWO2_12_FULL_36_74]